MRYFLTSFAKYSELQWIHHHRGPKRDPHRAGPSPLKVFSYSLQPAVLFKEKEILQYGNFLSWKCGKCKFCNISVKIVSILTYTQYTSHCVKLDSGRFRHIGPRIVWPRWVGPRGPIVRPKKWTNGPRTVRSWGPTVRCLIIRPNKVGTWAAGPNLPRTVPQNICLSYLTPSIC